MSQKSECLTTREWKGTLLSAGLVAAVAVLLDAQPGSVHSLLLIALGGSFVVTVVMGLLARSFSRNTDRESIRLQQEVHP